MQKIPTIFIREMSKQPAIVRDEPHPDCAWVFAGEGYPTRKWDGTCVLVRDGKLFGRREVKPGQHAPDSFELIEHDANTGKSFGWVPIDDGPEWKWHRAASEHIHPRDATYELCGPHVQGNPEGRLVDELIPHGHDVPTLAIERTYEGIKRALIELNWEGLVFYHPDGRRAKIKLKDYGIKRKLPA